MTTDHITLSAPQTAALAGVSVRHLYREVREGNITALTGGRGIELVFDPAAVAVWLRSRPERTGSRRPTTREGRERNRVLVGERVTVDSPPPAPRRADT